MAPKNTVNDRCPAYWCTALSFMPKILLFYSTVVNSCIKADGNYRYGIIGGGRRKDQG